MNETREVEAGAIQEERIGIFQFVIIALSIYVLGALFIDTVFDLPSEISQVLRIFDTLICIAFLVDFSLRFTRAPSKLQFMKWGWIDLISSIPTLDVLRTGRLIRIIRLIRILRAAHATRFIITYFFRNRRQSALAAVSTISILLLIFSSIAILQVEKDPSGNIKTAEDALWWGIATITTVGYGDKFPVTTEGRIIAAALMVAGVGLFGTFTGLIASWIMEDRRDCGKT